MRHTLMLAVLYLLLLLASYRLAEISEVAVWSTLAFTGLALVWHVVLLSSVHSASSRLRIRIDVRRPHVIQAILQFCIYVYWSLYWDAPSRYAPFILVQIVWAYMMDQLLGHTRRHEWRLGFGPVPIVLSINLFIWFRPEYFYLQLAMVSVTYLAKEFLTRESGGTRKHIFNPSGFSLTAAAVLLLTTDTAGTFTTGVELVESFELPPSFYEVVFLLGLVVQLQFGTAPVTLGAVASHYALFYAVSWYLGGRAAAFPIDRSIFLAMTLLVPDPATTPRTVKGRLLFGVLYGVSVFAAAMGLKYARQPDYFSKILVIPLLNLMVPAVDRAAARLHTALFPVSPDTTSSERRSSWKTRAAWTLIYSLLFVGIIDSLKRQRTTPLGRPWLIPVAAGGTPEMEATIINMIYCQRRCPEVYAPFGFRSEIEKYPVIRRTYDATLTREQLESVFGPQPRRNGPSHTNGRTE